VSASKILESWSRSWRRSERKSNAVKAVVSSSREVDNQEYLEEKDATINLKEMIESLTPKKKKLNGRKSLHVGAAKGILGKRPVELDDDEEDEDSKKVEGQRGSPVKNVKLPGPPSKVETTGRITRTNRKGSGQTADNIETATPTTGASPLRDKVQPHRRIKVVLRTLPQNPWPRSFWCHLRRNSMPSLKRLRSRRTRKIAFIYRIF
jgi:hypothetical protein